MRWERYHPDSTNGRWCVLVHLLGRPHAGLVCGKILAGECIYCKEQIELRPMYSCIASLTSVPPLQHFQCLFVTFPPSFEMHYFIISHLFVTLLCSQQQEIIDGCALAEGECGVLMHEHCLRNWLAIRETCPFHADDIWRTGRTLRRRVFLHDGTSLPLW